MSLQPKLQKRLRGAIKHFWNTRETQAQRQGKVSGSKDAGARSAVTGGAQMNGFVNLVRELLCESGLPKAHVYCEKYIELPGWYRPEKKWDLLIVSDKVLFAGIEFKSQVGPSFGNNYNNRTEEAIKRDGYLGRIPGRGIRAFRPALARVPHASRRSSAVDCARASARAAFHRLSRVQGCVLRETLRDSAHQACSGAALRCCLFPYVRSGAGSKRCISRTVAGAQL